MGCDVIDRIENRGIDKGINIGIDKVNMLMKKLFAQNRIDDAKRVSEDRQYCMQLLKEFALI